MSYAHVVDGSTPLRLADVDPADHGGSRESSGTRRLETLTEELRELQDLLFAAETEGVLVILQGMDAAGKDVTIRNVFAAASPEAIRVKHFTRMTEEERANDWRARRSWACYMDAYEATINATSTPEAPWAVIPADLQWFHNLAVAELLVERLTAYRKAWLAARQRIGEEKHDEAQQEMADGHA